MAFANVRINPTLVNDKFNINNERADLPWQAGVTYQPGDIVSLSGTGLLFMCKRENSLGNAPNLTQIRNELYSGVPNGDWLFIGDYRLPTFAGCGTSGQVIPHNVQTKVGNGTQFGDTNMMATPPYDLKPYLTGVYMVTAEVNFDVLTPNVGFVRLNVMRKRAGVTVMAANEQRAIDGSGEAHWGFMKGFQVFAGDEYWIEVLQTNGAARALGAYTTYMSMTHSGAYA